MEVETDELMSLEKAKNQSMFKKHANNKLAPISTAAYLANEYSGHANATSAVITLAQASRFLAQSTMGANKTEILSIATTGYNSWLNNQFNMPRNIKFWDFLANNGYNIPSNINTENGFDSMVWSQLITSGDQLRQRIGLALLDMLVVSINGISGPWRSNLMAAYLDVLWDNAFGNYREILEAISSNVAMGSYLTFLNSPKANPMTGSVPDENFARELMQLFTLGLYKLNMDGSLTLQNGSPVETYTQADVSGLARVWTGWVYANSDSATPDRAKLPMINNPSQHETGAKLFLGTNIPANTDAVASKKIALDAIFAHPNVPPFVSKQLIQRLVTSDPSSAYIFRIAKVFADNGNGVRGDMKAIIRAILTDVEARSDPTTATKTFGKLREPVVRLTQWARVFNVTSPNQLWPFGDTSSSVNKLSEAPGRSPSVFNFFRPGYVIPQTQDVLAPEFQIENEASSIAYINYMQTLIENGAGEAKPDYDALSNLATNSQTLLNELNLMLAANQISIQTIAQIQKALDSIPVATASGIANRIKAAILLIMASPEYLILK